MKSKTQNFIFLAVVIFLLITKPVLVVADKDARIGGWPVLYIYIASIWLLAIIATILIANSGKRKEDKPN